MSSPISPKQLGAPFFIDQLAGTCLTPTQLLICSSFSRKKSQSFARLLITKHQPVDDTCHCSPLTSSSSRARLTTSILSPDAYGVPTRYQDHDLGCFSAYKGNPARENPGLKVKLLVGPTCKIPRSTQRER